jgi:hypothetical protein
MEIAHDFAPKIASKAQRAPRLTRPQQRYDRTSAEPACPLDSRVVAMATYDSLSSSLSQLSAMLNTVSAGFETFNDLSPKVKENYLWACATLATECEQMVDRLDIEGAPKRTVT